MSLNKKKINFQTVNLKNYKKINNNKITKINN